MILRVFHFCVRRTLVLFVAAGLLSWGLVDLDKMKVKMINRVVPESNRDLVAFSLNPTASDTTRLQKYLLYFKTVVKILPDSAAAHALLGYCYYYTGDVPRARDHLRRASEINPQFFWYLYDLGVSYYRQGLYQQAMPFLEKAMACHPEETLLLIRVSKIYKELDAYAVELGYNTEQGLKEGYHHVYELLLLCRYNMGGAMQQQYQVKIF